MNNCKFFDNKEAALEHYRQQSRISVLLVSDDGRYAVASTLAASILSCGGFRELKRG